METRTPQQDDGPAAKNDPPAKGLATETFEAFRASVVSPSLKAVVDHWHEARSAQLMPSWEQLRPSGMAKQLPIIWSYKFDSNTQQFVGRLAGDKISQIFGKNFRGLPLKDAHPASAFPWVHRLLCRVVLDPAIYRSVGRVFKQLERYGLGERVILPLATDGVVADGLLGATDYQYTHLGSSNEAIEVVTESEHWHCLRPARSR